MYSPKIIAVKASQIESAYPIKIKEYSINEIQEWVVRLQQLVHPESTPAKPKLTRQLYQDELDFISNEILLCKISYPYWVERYCFIKYDKGGVGRIKLAESQEMLLRVLASLEESNKPAKLIILKARQVYASTFSETVLTHKAMNIPGITCVVASDEPNKSEFLFNMMERIYDNLPFYLKPRKKFHVKGQQLYFDSLDSLIDVDSGNKKVGGIGQGMTIHNGHLSELATWNDTDQITQDLIPALTSGETPRTFFAMESTANGKFGSWYEWWKSAKRKEFHGFVPVFIPWWAMTEKYSDDPPEGWEPSIRVLKLAAQTKQTKGVDLTRKQMYWWDHQYTSYKAGNKLHEFYAEYASDDQEAFQLAGKTVFDTEKLNDLMRIAKTRTSAVYELQERLVIRT